MPDFERVFDDLALNLADSDEDKAYVKGFIEGKKHARKELLILMLFGMSLSLCILLFGTSPTTLIFSLCVFLAIFIYFVRRSPTALKLPSKNNTVS